MIGNPSRNRRALLKACAPALLLAAIPVHAAPTVTVYKNASCGCCGEWVKYLRRNGFTVNAMDVQDVTPYKRKLGVPRQAESCHTAVVEGYVIEGHVPAREIKRLLAERPKAKGLAVPDMPVGSPGMEGDRRDPYDVLLVLPDGSHTVYARYGR